MRAATVTLAGAALLVSAAPAQAAGMTWFRVSEATHTSSAAYASPGATGRATMRWRLARPTATATNRMYVSAPGLPLSGYGRVNVRGHVTAEATTKRGRCALSAQTGSPRYGSDVPVPFSLNLSAHPAGGLQVALDARYAHLLSDHFGSECGLPGTEPVSPKITHVTRIPASAVKRRRLVLSYRGSGGGRFDAYRWSTRVVLVRTNAP
jgi:hypothetical protein